MGGRLEEIFKTRAERVVFVKGDPSIDFQWVAKAIDIAHGAGIDKVGSDDCERWRPGNNMRKVMLVLRWWPRWRVSASSCNQLKARDQLNKGVQAFNRRPICRRPSSASRPPSNSIPDFSAARLYLATAYMQQYIPGADSPREQCRWRTAAIDNFMKVLRAGTEGHRSPSPRLLPSTSTRRSGTKRSSGTKS